MTSRAITDNASLHSLRDVLGLRCGHGGEEYELLLNGDEMVAQLHQRDAREHPHLEDQLDPSRGNGALLWFATDNHDALVAWVQAR